MSDFLKFNIKNNLLIGCIASIFFLILFFNIGFLPFDNLGDFLFFAVLTFAFALYRPGWAFLFFIGTVILENIYLIPKEIGLTLRPYQLLGGLVLLAVIIRFFIKKLNFNLPKFKWFDIAIILFGLTGFFSTSFSLEKILSFKLAIVIFSFIFLYFLTRIFIQDIKDLSRIIPFFISASLLISLYGIWQNVLFAQGKNAFEIMPGRPNATFTEPDWLGIFIVLFIIALYSLLLYLFKKKEDVFDYKKIFHFLFLVIANIALILTVSRSAWLGVGIATIVFLVVILFLNRKIFLRYIVFIVSAGLVSLLAVYIFNLTTFQLFNRVQSTGGLQKITIACIENIDLPERISDISELERYNCKHINLEDIDQEKNLGLEVKEIYRTDPNVNIRAEIYQKSWQQIKMHPITGIGWGSIGSVLGKDERGASLNSSNIFLEIWLGSGILGFIAFLSVWVYIFGKSIYEFFKSNSEILKIFSLFTAISWLGITIANLFNAGILLGFLWVYIAVVLIDYKKDAK